MKRTADERDSGFDRLVQRELSRGASPADDCPQVELLAAWFDRALPPDELRGVEAHLTSCLRCQEVLGSLARTEPEVLYVRPQRAPRPWTWHLRWATPVAAAALVVLVVASRSLMAPGVPQQAASSMKAGDIVLPGPPAAAAHPVPIEESRTARSLRDERAPAPPAVTPSPLSKEQVARPPELEKKVALGKAEGDTARTLELQSRPSVPLPTKTAAAPGPPSQVLADAAKPAAPPAPVPAEGARENRAAAAPPAGIPEAIAVTGEPQAGARTRAAFASASSAVPRFVGGGRIGWRYARPGVVLRSDDGGKSWVEQRVPGEAQLLALSAVSPEVCWGAGRSGAVVRTTDGAIWQVIRAPVIADFVAVIALDAMRASVRAADGSVFETSDGGATWRRK